MYNSANNDTLKKDTKCTATISTCKAKEKVLRHLSTKYLCTASDTSSTWMYILLKIDTRYSYCNSRSIEKKHHKLYATLKTERKIYIAAYMTNKTNEKKNNKTTYINCGK